MEPKQFRTDLVAPCGMNCNVCKSYLAQSRGVPTKKGKVSHCLGCRPRAKNCYIKRGCPKLRSNQVQFCYECSEMPCKSLSHLEKRYNERYATSLVGNLQEIKKKGLEQFLRTQEVRFRCLSCGDFVSVHDRKCYACGKVTSA